MQIKKNVVVMTTHGFGWSSISTEDGGWMSTLFEKQGVHCHGYKEGGAAVRIALVPGVGRVKSPSFGTVLAI